MKIEKSAISNRVYVNAKNTKTDLLKLADHRFVVFGINEDGSRASTYGNVSVMNLLEELVNQRRKTVVIRAEDITEFERRFGYYGNSNCMQDPNFEKNARKYQVSFSIL